jgi:hypothetical protein
MSKARQLAQKPSQPTGRKNLIINGAMQIWQRGETQDTATTGDYMCDRWRVEFGGTDGNLDWDKTGIGETDTSVPDEFANALKISMDASESSLDASDYVLINQRLEGQDLQHLRKGFSDAKKVTLSFWVRSSVASTYTAEFKDNDNNRLISATYTINTADTWEYKTITFDGDTSSTDKFDNDNNNSAAVIFWLDGGTTFTSGTHDTSWQDTTASERVYDTTGWLESSSPTFYITGVQLEVGSTATEFEHRSYGEELALCQRYYYRWEQANSGVSSHALHIIGMYQATRGFFGISAPVPMRQSPSIGELGSLALTSPGLGSDGTISSLSTYASDDNNTRFSVDATVSGGTANVYRSIYAGHNSGIVLNAEL